MYSLRQAPIYHLPSTNNHLPTTNNQQPTCSSSFIKYAEPILLLQEQTKCPQPVKNPSAEKKKNFFFELVVVGPFFPSKITE